MDILQKEKFLGHESAAVGIARERMVVEFAEHLVHVDGHAQQLLILLEE